MIDRCLFIRFLEDRAGLTRLQDILSDKYENKINKLTDLFDEYTDRLNGDIFEKGDIPKDINNQVAEELAKIFGNIYFIQKKRQATLFPYSFQSIPIILISNIYERFLSKQKRKAEGIVFTPPNVVNYALDKMLDDESLIKKIENNELKILDPSCGSGVFLIKILEEIINKLQFNQNKLSLEKKAEIILNSIYGIDKNSDALRIAALSLYLKIIEGEKTEDIQDKLFDESSNHFMFPGLKKNGNLVHGDSLFNDIYNGLKFDIIIGNPPWGYEYSKIEKNLIEKKWPRVAGYQSSQCFLFQIKKWMTEDTICGMVVNLSNFTNSQSINFRKAFSKEYYIKLFVNLSNVKKITFGPSSEPSCILIFYHKSHLINHLNIDKDDIDKYEIKFITPEISRFSLLTKILTDSAISMTTVDKLAISDKLWHFYSHGYDIYNELINYLDRKKNRLNDFNKRFEVGTMKFSKKLGLTKEEYYNKYTSPNKISENHYPMVDSLRDIEVYFGNKPSYYFEYGENNLDRKRDINLFKGDKLIITRSADVRAFIDMDTNLYDSNFFIFKLKNLPKEYLCLFEAIINSALSKFYLGVKYQLRKGGNFSKINLDHLKQFPIPDMNGKQNIINEIIKCANSLKKSRKNSAINECEDHLIQKIDKLIFSFYELDYYFIEQIYHFIKVEKNKRKRIVSKMDLEEYCNEFIETFKPFVKDDCQINAISEISDFFGAMVKFIITREIQEEFIDDKRLENFISIIEGYDINGYNRRMFFNEEKIKFYDGDIFYIYKSNKPKDWTKFMAIKDANEEIADFFCNMDVA